MFIEAKVDGGGGDNWSTGAISRAKLQSNNHHQQTNIQFLQAGCPSCRPINSVKAPKSAPLYNKLIRPAVQNNVFSLGRMSALFISLFVLALVVLFYYVIVLYIQFVLELNSIK